MSIKWDKVGLQHIQNAITESLREFGNALDHDIKDSQVVPKETGALENSQTIELIDKNTLRISYSTDYAARLYFHPEYQFSHEQNANAQGRWLEPIFSDKEFAKKYADILKEKI